MNIIQAVFIGVVTSIVLSVLTFLKKIIGYVINRHPDVKKARKEKELYQKLTSAASRKLLCKEGGSSD
jgi:Na+-transporting methylmalonyl-CoA/oxaloacetate decarboxylase gamma subunit